MTVTEADETRYWLGFSLVPNIGLKRIQHLRSAFGSLETAWKAPERDLARLNLGPKTLDSLLHARKRLDLNAEMNKLQKVGAWLVTLDDPRYPVNLKPLDEAPAVLYVRGSLTPADELALAVVGTRKATKGGRDATFDLSKRLAENSVTIVSGLAHGVDTAAHQGALQGGGRTIAVMGCGVDVDYPTENRGLAQTIIRRGAIISEFAMGMRPLATNFPRRNRIISGISLGVLVTEAPVDSGALITANFAAEQGREVFAVPGSIYNRAAAGTNRLIQDGAKLVMDERDILEELNIRHEKRQTRVRTEQVSPSNEQEHRLLQILSTDPLHIDELVRLSGLSIVEVTSTLTILELKGLAEMIGHMQYSRTNSLS